MPQLIPPGLITDLQMVLTDSLSETCTNTRTSAVLACRINADTHEVHLEGTPTYLRLRRWQITLTAGVDVVVGDTLTITGKGAFVVLTLASPNSFNVSTRVYAVAITQSGTSTLPILPNASVTFTNPTTSQTLTSVSVFIQRVQRDPVMLDAGVQYKWSVVWDPTLHFADGTPVGSLHDITWTPLPTPGHRSTLQKAWQVYGLLPLAGAYFEESD